MQLTFSLLRKLQRDMRQEFQLHLDIHGVQRAFTSQDWDVIFLFAQTVNACAKAASDDWYYTKSDVLQYVIAERPHGVRYHDGVLYAETSEGQVSFHVFYGDEEILVNGLTEEPVNVWVQDLDQFEAPEALCRALAA